MMSLLPAPFDGVGVLPRAFASPLAIFCCANSLTTLANCLNCPSRALIADVSSDVMMDATAARSSNAGRTYLSTVADPQVTRRSSSCVERHPSPSWSALGELGHHKIFQKGSRTFECSAAEIREQRMPWRGPKRVNWAQPRAGCACFSLAL